MDNSLAGISPEYVRSLGPFTPSELDPAAIELELKPKLPSCCQGGRIGVRVPQGAPALEGNLTWHHDQDVKHMIVWALEKPTEFRLPDGTIVTPPPGELIWFDNNLVEHRQPAETNEWTRWFVAVRCGG